MRALRLLTLLVLAASACDSSTKDDDVLLAEADWSYAASGRVAGVALRPNGDVVLAVGAGNAPFLDGGGAVVFSPDGELRSEIPMVLERPCDSCTRLVFQPNAPLVTGSGDLLVGDYQNNLFRLAPDDSVEWLPITNPGGVSLGLYGIDGSSAASADGERLYLAGTSLAVVSSSGAILEGVDFGEVVRQIVPLGGSTYLLNVTGAFDDIGTLIRWNASSGERTTIELPAPVVAIASKEGWTVAAMEVGLGLFRLAEVEAMQPSPTVKPLAEFDLPAGRINLALRPGERQVVAGSSGVRATHGGTTAILVGSAVLVDADEGPIVGADVSSVQGLAISADGSTVYVADTAGLHAFSLPDD